MHCSGFEVNNKPRDLPSALFFIKKKKRQAIVSFTREITCFLRRPHILQAYSAQFSSFQNSCVKLRFMKWVYFSHLFYLFSNILAFFLVTKFLVFCVFLAKINQICGRNKAIRKTLKYLFTQYTFKCKLYTFKFK